MSEHLPDISGKDFIKLLKKMGFDVVRTNGSHHRLKHDNGRVTTLPVHKKRFVAKRLVAKNHTR